MRRTHDTPGARLDPVPLPAEGVGRQTQQATSFAGQRGEVDIDPRGPRPGQGEQAVGRVVHLLVRVPQGGDGDRRLDGLAASVRRQRVTGPQLDEDQRAVGEHRGQAVGEAHRATEVVDPVLRIRRLLGRDPRPAEVGQVWHLWRRQLDAAHDVQERGEDRIEQGAVGGGSEGDERGRDVLGGQALLERLDVDSRTGDDALVCRR